jgi:tetratricopeptide (TPR) repeat protein
MKPMPTPPHADPQPDISTWRRAQAYWWYAWGLSWCRWGIYTAEQSFFRAGIRSFDRAIRAWPEFAHGFYRRGFIRGRELSEHREAITDLSQAITLRPDWAEPYLQRGLFQRFHGDLQAALDDLQQYVALTADPFWRREAQRQIESIAAEIDQPHEHGIEH